MRKVKFAPENIYHIYNRGVEERDIFLSDNDRWRFLQGLFLFNDEKTASNILFRLERDKKKLNFKTLREYLERETQERKPLVRIMLDCLRPNHFHLALEEVKGGGIPRFMQKVGIGYTKYFNTKYERSGHLFQGRFQAVHVENDEQFQYLFVYINAINPLQEIEPRVKEDGVQDIEKAMRFLDDHLWSTHQEYIGKRDSVLIDKGIAANIFPTIKEYELFVRDILLRKKNLEPIKNLILY
ncbi:MAG: transposase [bacterium]